MPQKLDAFIERLRPIVTEIEGRVPTTRGHYGDYLTILTTFATDRVQANVLANILIAAGANERGVTDALRVSFLDELRA